VSRVEMPGGLVYSEEMLGYLARKLTIDKTIFSWYDKGDFDGRECLASVRPHGLLTLYPKALRLSGDFWAICAVRDADNGGLKCV